MIKVYIFLFLCLQYNANALHRVCFSPNEGNCSCEKNVVEMLNLATNKIDLAIYALNNKNITNAIIDAKKRGIIIRIVYDKYQSLSSGSLLKVLSENKIEMYHNYKHKIEHNKFIIIDNQIVMNGSFNFTETAEHHNSENCTVHDSIKVVKAFSDRFDYLFNLYKNAFLQKQDDLNDKNPEIEAT